MGLKTFFTGSSPPRDNRRNSSAVTTTSTEEYNDDNKDPVVTDNHALVDQDGISISSEAGDGVKKAHATTIAWSRNALIVAYLLIYLIYFINSLQQQTSNSLIQYVYSDFTKLGLITTAGVVSSVVAGVIKLPVAKLMDIFGRPQGFVFMLTCAVIGLILMAACQNVEMYAAAQTFYWVGMNGMDYVLDVFIADTSSLKWRGVMIAFSTSPFIATTFAGPAAAQSFLRTSGWRWGYGTYTIVTPVIALPFLWIFWYNARQAKKQGILVEKREASGRTALQSVRHYFIEFDFIGIILITAGFVLFLLPFSIATSQARQWRAASTIAMLVIGFCCLIAFGLHEKWTAKKTFLPFHFLVDRTVLGACFLAGTLFISFYCWNAYFNPYLQVVHGLSIADAGYVANIYSLGSCFFSIVTGFAIRYSGGFKWIALCAVPVQILGTGLMIYFRGGHWGIGYVVMCQIFISFSGGALVVTEQIAIMAAVGPEHVAVALALESLFTSIGGAIGSSISGGIWTNTFPSLLQRHLPADAQADYLSIYGNLTMQLSYPQGSPVRVGINEAYQDAQRYMCIAATAVLAAAFFFVLMWRNIKVKDFKKSTNSTVV